MKASPEVWKAVWIWLAINFVTAFVVGVLTYQGYLVLFG